MIFTKARMIGWGIKALGVAALGGSIWFAGQNFGLDRGYDKAYDNYQKELENANELWYNTLQERDEEWQAQISNSYKELQEQIDKYQEVERREQELLTRITVLESTLLEITYEYENTDFGVCDVSPEFDGLLRSAHKAATDRQD